LAIRSRLQLLEDCPRSHKNRRMANYAYTFAGIFVAAMLWKKFTNRNTFISKEKLPSTSVLITGCDSGFGEATAIELYNRGLKVFAACLTSEGVVRLENLSKTGSGKGQLFPFVCDITKDADIEQAVQFVTANSPNGLWALINNAGIGAGGPIEWCPMSMYRKVLDVNFFGHVAVTKAFLPLIRKVKGRVINITSVAGTFAGPHMSCYSASKFALEAFTDSLRREMFAFGVKVINIAPAFMNTPIVQNYDARARALWDQLPANIKATYSPGYLEKMIGLSKDVISKSQNPKLVVDTLIGAVFGRNPREKYFVGKGTAILVWMISLLPVSFMDSNVRKRAKALYAAVQQNSEKM